MATVKFRPSFIVTLSSAFLPHLHLSYFKETPMFPIWNPKTSSSQFLFTDFRISYQNWDWTWWEVGRCTWTATIAANHLLVHGVCHLLQEWIQIDPQFLYLIVIVAWGQPCLRKTPQKPWETILHMSISQGIFERKNWPLKLYLPYIPLLFMISPFMQLQNDARNCQCFIWLDEWEEILASKAAINGEEKNLSRNDGEEPVNGRLLGQGREVEKRYPIEEKWKTRLNSKLENLAVDLMMSKCLIFVSIIMQLFNMIMQKKWNIWGTKYFAFLLCSFNNM